MLLTRQFKHFREFYPYYLEQHSNLNCRRLHFLGTTLALAVIGYALCTQMWWALLLAPVFGYSFAWIGHFVFEKNKPAAFSNFGYSFMGDWMMYKDILMGKVKLW